jgi:hypothetical protein
MFLKRLCLSLVLLSLLPAPLIAQAEEGPHLVFEIYLQQPESNKAAMLRHETKSVTWLPFEESSIAAVWQAAVEALLQDADMHYGKQAQSILPSGEPDVIDSVTLMTWSLYVDPFAPWQLTKGAGSLREATDLERELLMRDGGSLCRFYPDWLPNHADNTEPVDLALDDQSLVGCLAKARNTLQNGQHARVLFLHNSEKRTYLAESSVHRPL